MMNSVLGIIIAFDNDNDLREITEHRTVGAVQWSGRYRIIDFMLSNMVNSGIRNIGIIPKKNYQSLIDHVGSGKEWDLNRKNDGLFILPPYDTFENTGSYNGLVDTIKGAAAYLRRARQKYCLLTGSYTLYSGTYNEMFEQHIDTGADITILYNEEKKCAESGGHFKDLRLTLNDDGRVTDICIQQQRQFRGRIILRILYCNCSGGCICIHHIG